MMLFRAVRLLPLVFLISASISSAFDTLKVDASLDTLKKQIIGSVEYRLPSSPTLSTYEFQLFANIYSSEDSPYLKKSGHQLDYFKRTNTWGEMVIDSALLDGNNVTEYLHVDFTKGVLGAESLPNLNGSTVLLFFRTRLPEVSDRLSCFGGDYLLDGWFPNPAILREDGSWHHPRYGPFSELVGEYFEYEINLVLPGNLKVGAAVPSVESSVDDTLVAHRFSFGPAHDFALALSSDYLIDSSMVGGKMIRVFYRDFEKPVVRRVVKAAQQTLEFMAERVGEYYYSSLTLALVNNPYVGGVEFPGFIALASPRGRMMIGRQYESLVMHEVVHQWFYGMIGSDQVEAPWMDESISNFFTQEVLVAYYGSEANLFDFAGFKFSERDLLRASSRISSGGSGINRPAYSFLDDADYFSTVYSKGPLMIETFDNLLGDSLSSVFWRRYYNDYRFGHPDADDFLRLAGEMAGENILKVLEFLLNSGGEIDFAVYDLKNTAVDSANFEVSVTLQKEEGLSHPVDYSLILQNGDTLNYTWVPEYNIEEKIFTLPSPAKSAIIDPENLFAVDKNLLNNSISTGTDSRPGLRLSSGIMFLIESFFSFIGGM